MVDELTYVPETPLETWTVRQAAQMNVFELETEAMGFDPDEFPLKS